MKCLIIGVVICVLIAGNLSAPVEDEIETRFDELSREGAVEEVKIDKEEGTKLEELEEDNVVEDADNDSHTRERRYVTCIIGKIPIEGVQLNDAACAAKCYTKKRPGGYCSHGRCQCR
ncbi:tenecin-1 [Diabrotica virgifera virgifera]|uniref:Tenecin-1-like n=1 Tax=Diabrotica virgifera virgifera TaxID=50390 RepID=A0A6P7EY52_DIAVI|nr:tenecin-1 [Diabrotica virgifera virgifera]